MCGIIGYIGKNKAIPKIIKGLEALEYRGYDSAGIAYLFNGEVIVKKEKGKISNLKKIVDEDTQTSMGIGHTRWATHGEANQVNAHPQRVGNITIVHNGIIENYAELKKELEKTYEFKSETDTEVAAALIDKFYQTDKDILRALQNATNEFRGSFAIGVIVDGDDSFYAIRNVSPLIVAIGDNEYFIASDVPAILENTKKYMLINDKEIVHLMHDEVIIYDNGLNIQQREIKEYEGSYDAASKSGYDHFMLKEINEQDQVFKDTVNYYFDGTKESLEKSFGILKDFKKIDIVACGSAYHTGVVGKYLIEKYANIPVNPEVASEYRYKKCFYDKDTLVVLVSQSGETADTLAALKKAKEDGIKTLAIVNVVGSSIAREADYVIYIKAGFEIAVATTKAYLAQASIFSLIALYLGCKNNLISDSEFEIIANEIKRMPELIKETINNDAYVNIANNIYQRRDMFLIGRGIDYAISLEASLKIKEISYINSVAYQAGELKHGTISLIEDGTPVIAICTDDELKEKMVSNIKEVKARGAKVVLVSNGSDDKEYYDELINIAKIHPILQPILTIIPLQLLSYSIAKNNGCDIDKPRNLAKSVTVE